MSHPRTKNLWAGPTPKVGACCLLLVNVACELDACERCAWSLDNGAIACNDTGNVLGMTTLELY